jgi:hypothetical protein
LSALAAVPTLRCFQLLVSLEVALGTESRAMDHLEDRKEDLAAIHLEVPLADLVA